MDTSPIYPFLLLAIVYLIYLLLRKLYLPRIYGSLGEFRIARRLRRLNKEKYKVYNNLYLENKGRTTQIDHLVLSIYGIFVIETKNYKGWIFGNERSKYWTQTLYNTKHQFYNPILQNWTHVNFLKGISKDINELPFFPIVVFAGKAKLKKIDALTPVIRRRKLLRTIKRHRNVYISYEQLSVLDDLIRSVRVEGREIRKKHKKGVKQRIKKKSSSGICPRCGGKLVQRHGKFGPFKGCTNYPRCKFTTKFK